MSATENSSALPLTVRRGAMILFILSGFTSLIYQAVWIRLLSLSVGSTSASMSLVLSIFFFGLAAGSYVFGRRSPSITKPLLVYGILEGIIGSISFVLIYALLNFHKLMAFVYPQGSLTALGHTAKFVLVFALFIIPTFAMGATLPLLIRLFSNAKAGAERARSISALYAINTLGAVLGAFSAGFVLFPAVGIVGANQLAALGNVLIFVVCVFFQKRHDRALSLTKIETGATDAAENRSNSKRLALLTLSTGVAGFSSIAAEVVWSKYLGIFLGTNIFGLSLILTLFLIGIAGGSFLLSRFVHRVSNQALLLVGLLVGAVVATVGSTIFLGALPVVANLLAYYFAPKVSLLAIKCVLVSVTLIVPTLFFGALLPLTIHLLTGGRKEASSSTGVVYAINTAGAILGSYLAGVILIPRFGSSLTMVVAIGLLALMALVLAFALLARRRERLAIVAIMGLVLLPAARFGSLDFQNIIRSAYQQKLEPGLELSQLLEIFSKSQEEFQLVREGETAIISLSHDADDGPQYERYLRLKTNGLNESVYDTQNLDLLPKYEALLGLLPYALSRDPQKAFIIGYGGGYSVRFLSTTDLKKVFVAEIEKGILEAAAYAHGGDNPILKRPSVDVRIEDARFLLAAGTEAPFDIIASQPSHSWLSGVANLFTVEFFELVRSRLKPNGIFSQWLNLYNMSPEVLASILKTFYTVFPHGAVFTNLHDDELILIGSQAPVVFDLEKVQQLMKNPRIAREVSGIPLTSATDLVAHLTLSREDALAFSKDAPINSDRNAYGELRQSELFYRRENSSVRGYLDGRFRASYDAILAPKKIQDDETIFGILDSLQFFRNFRKYNAVLAAFDARLGPKHLGRLAGAYYQMERYTSALTAAMKSIEGAKPQAQDVNLAVEVLARLERFDEAQALLARHRALRGRQSDCQELYILTRSGRLSAAKPIADRLLASMNGAGGTLAQCGVASHLYLGEYFATQSAHEKAVQHLSTYHQAHPQHLRAYELLMSSLLSAQAPKEAKDQARALIEGYSEARQAELQRLVDLEAWYREAGYKDDADALAKILARL